VILLPGTRRNRVRGGGVTEHLVLADEGGGHVLRDHEPRVESAVVGEERGQAVGERRVDEPLDAPLRDRRELGHRERHRVECQRDGLAVEVPVGDELAPVYEHEGIIRRSIDLDRDGLLDVG
jgi:hypothetical protein